MTIQQSRVRNRPKTINRRLRGKGDYTEEIIKIPSVPRRIEAKIDHLEKMLNQSKPSLKKSLGELGTLAGEGIAKLFGGGDYVIHTNSLMKGRYSSATPPKFSSQSRGTRITEREFICDITSGTLTAGSTNFSNLNLPIIPSNRTTFPWLSTIALQFDQWEPHGLVFYFKSSSSTFNGASQALGTVVMATDYDVTDPLYSSKQVMENSDYACSTKPSEDLVHGIECAAKERPTELLYTSVTTGQERLSTLGNFQIASLGCSAADIKLGELWVSYDISFYKKQLVSPCINSYAITGSGSAGVGQVFYNNPTIAYNNGFTIVNTSTYSRIYFPSALAYGRFELSYALYLVDAADVASYVTTYFNCNRVTYTETWTAGSSPGQLNKAVDVTGPGAYVTITGTKSTAASNYHFCITEIASGAGF